MGRNLGIRRDIFHRLDRRMDYIQRHDPQPGSLIGWSLGGLIAREYAKYAPDRVAKVITLGSPFSGDLRANHAWRIYELVARHRIDSPDRKHVVSGKSVSVRVDLGVRRIIEKKKLDTQESQVRHTHKKS